MRSQISSLLMCLGTLLTLNAHGEDLAGTWQYDRATEYFGQLKIVPPPIVTTLQIIGEKMAVNTHCTIALKPIKYNYSDVFQSLLKEDVKEFALEKYLNKNFDVSLQKTQKYYHAESQPSDCNNPIRDIFYFERKLIVPFGGSVFYVFLRNDGSAKKTTPSEVQLYGHQPSQLPFSPANFASLCQETIPRSKGIPQLTDKCSPVFYPYIANAKDNDTLSQLIGTHDYKKGGARHADDYTNPLANKLHPIFMILPPLKDVIIVRVDDLEPGSESRDTMSGVYLSIKDGKIIDQMNEGCAITIDYACIDNEGKKQYQLLESGKFKKLN